MNNVIRVVRVPRHAVAFFLALILAAGAFFYFSGNPVASTTPEAVGANVVIPGFCAISLNNALISFGDSTVGILDGSTSGTVNGILDTDSVGNANANILVMGTNWYWHGNSISGNNFLVGNTFWNPSYSTSAVGNAVALNGGTQASFVDTGILVPAAVGSTPGTNAIYFGMNVPTNTLGNNQGILAGSYNQVISVQNGC